jgi:DNA-binding response OmpR family regulator
VTSARVLVIEDEPTLRLALGDALRAEGFEVTECADGESGLATALRDGPDVVLLDLMLPGRDGFSVLRALREDRLEAAILVLSARGEEETRVRGFEVGADDYIVKPFSTRELVLRVHAALARTRGADQGHRRVRVGDATIDFAAFRIERGKERLPLSRKELDLLRYLVDHEDQVLSRARLLDDVWGKDAFPGERTVDTHVLKLRKKLEPDPERPRFLLTVHGVGYCFTRGGGVTSR